jgi:hypothetical protein
VADDARPFRMRSAWLPITLFVISVVYFAVVLLLVATNQAIGGVDNDQLALGGIALFVLSILVAIPYFLRRTSPKPRVEPEPLMDDMQDEPMAASDAPRFTGWDDETRTTSEEKQGMKVLEYSRPAKSRHRGAVYTKDYVPVAKEWVLRVETMVAEGADL